VVGSCEHGDEPSDSGAMELVTYMIRYLLCSCVQYGIKYDHRSLASVSCNIISRTHFVSWVHITFCVVIKCDYFRFAFVTKINTGIFFLTERSLYRTSKHPFHL
jgi:hypothetical protein